jgi:hypothetical protein
MSTPAIGIGFLRVIDILSDVSYSLFEPIVAQVFPANITAGVQTIPVFDPSIYVGCQLVVSPLTSNIEVITVTAVTGGSFTALFANPHYAGEAIQGATFPVRQPNDPLLTQSEVIAYLSTALSDFLTDCPLYYEISESVSVPATQQNVALPSDCMFPVRIAAFGYPLRETSQSNLDIVDYRWAQQSATTPMVYFRDKIPMQNIGVWPRANNATPLEIVYAARGATTLGLADGFPIPDPFLLGVKYRTLSFCYSKDGEIRQPALARYWDSRYQFGVKVSRMILEAVNDPSLEMAQ